MLGGLLQIIYAAIQILSEDDVVDNFVLVFFKKNSLINP